MKALISKTNEFITELEDRLAAVYEVDNSRYQSISHDLLFLRGVSIGLSLASLCTDDYTAAENLLSTQLESIAKDIKEYALAQNLPLPN